MWSEVFINSSDNEKHFWFWMQKAPTESLQQDILWEDILERVFCLYNFIQSKDYMFIVAATLCDPMNCSLPGSSVHGISQARILECVAISFSKGSFWPRDQIQVSCIWQVDSLPLSHQRKNSHVEIQIVRGKKSAFHKKYILKLWLKLKRKKNELTRKFTDNRLDFDIERMEVLSLLECQHTTAVSLFQLLSHIKFIVT